jgi:DmsE family decaheme c-type cytochrome
MNRRIRKAGPALWLALGFMIWFVAFASARATALPGGGVRLAAKKTAQAPKSTQAQPTASTSTQPKYIGEKACLDCHESQREGYYRSPHHRSTDPRSPAAKASCESCHGPGSAHADDPQKNSVKALTPKTPEEVTATCTSCHNKGEHTLWNGSQHEARGLTCTTCHSEHMYKSEKAQLKKETQLQLCATCHRDKVAKLDRSGHMPVREGKMQCTTCHNTHGSTNVKLLRKGDSVAEMCTSCHADKRGPYLWEHAPARDGCVSCHDPHGSSNERMLVAKLPMLCQRCHVATSHPSTIYDAAILATNVHTYARSCVTCHAAIHGSNHPSGQRFVR